MEIFSIAFTGALVWLCALAQNVDHAIKLGPQFVMSDRSGRPSENGFAGRAARTLQNNLESAVMFIPVTMGVILLHKTSPLTANAALVYTIARFFFTLFYYFGLNKARSTAWSVGMVCIAIMFLRVTLPT
jgi:uncharacterized MAPEG superfamily protein